MEHRCGIRHTADIPVQLRVVQGGLTAWAILSEWSISGALLRTDLPIAELVRVSVKFPRALLAARLQGTVVRRNDDALALEWDQLAIQLARRLDNTYGYCPVRIQQAALNNRSYLQMVVPTIAAAARARSAGA